MIGVNGENLNPNLLEPQLATEGVARLCLLGLPVDRGSIVLLAEVSPYIDRPRLEQIRSALSERITQSGLGGQINRVLFTATPLLGKDDYKLARKQIAERLAAGKLCLIDPNAMGSDGEEGDRRLADRLRQIFAEALNRSPEEIADAMEPFRKGYSLVRGAYAMMRRPRWAEVYMSVYIAFNLGWRCRILNRLRSSVQ